MFKKIYIILILIITVGQLFAQKQNNKSQLAYQYYRDKEYDKAALVYKELYESGKSTTYLNYLIKCYIADEQYKKAEETLNSEIKTNRNNPILKVQLASVYYASGNKKKAIKLYEKSIDKLKGDHRSQVIQLANAFISQGEFKYAEKTYLKGKALSKGEYNYGFELANIYYYSRDYQKMIDAYLDVLEESPRYLKTVQNRLQASVYKQDDGSLNQILKTELIRRIQKSKSNTIYSELLIWLYLQEKKFNSAYIQTKALVKRNNEDGKRLIVLGELAFNNNDLTTALNCYQFVIDLGKNRTFYLDAKIGYFQTTQAKVINKEVVSETELRTLISTYNEFLNSIGNIPEAIDLKINYAHILAFYDHKATEATLILEQIIDKEIMKNPQKSRVRMELADILLLDNKIWEATLYYSQIIKSNPNNEIGNEAQIKKAKLAYYSGDFLWAKGRLDVLKASTSKLIANDAFYLSSIIADNLKDSLELPLQLFAKADLLIFQNKKEKALDILDSIQNQFPNHSLSDDVLYKKAGLYEQLGKDSIAKELYQEILDKYYNDILADNALMALAKLYSKENNPEKAMELYTQLLEDFSDSFFTSEARRKIVEYRDS